MQNEEKKHKKGKTETYIDYLKKYGTTNITIDAHLTNELIAYSALRLALSTINISINICAVPFTMYGTLTWHLLLLAM